MAQIINKVNIKSGFNSGAISGPGIIIFLFPILNLTIPKAGTLLIIGLTVVSIIALLHRRRMDGAAIMLSVGYILFLAIAVLSLIRTSSYPEAFKELEIYVRVLALPALYLFIKERVEFLWKYFVSGIIVGALAMALVAIYQLFVEGIPIATGAYHRIEYGDFALMISVFLLSIAIEQIDRGKIFYLALLGIFCSLIAAVYTGSRGVVVVIPIILLSIYVFGLIGSEPHIKTRKSINMGVIIIVIFLVGFISYDYIYSGLMRAKSDIVEYDKNAGMPSRVIVKSVPSPIGDRINMWRDSLYIVRESPIIGTGLGDFKTDSEELIKQRKSQATWTYSNAHSILFHSLATTGIVGVIAMIISFLAIPWYIVRNHKLEKFSQIQRVSYVAGRTLLLLLIVTGLRVDWLLSSVLMNAYILFVSFVLAGSNITTNKGKTLVGRPSGDVAV